jgi:hypothetical protein
MRCSVIEFHRASQMSIAEIKSSALTNSITTHFYTVTFISHGCQVASKSILYEGTHESHMAKSAAVLYMKSLAYNNCPHFMNASPNGLYVMRLTHIPNAPLFTHMKTFHAGIFLANRRTRPHMFRIYFHVAACHFHTYWLLL